VPSLTKACHSRSSILLAIARAYGKMRA
jgi:hypothetical protein